MTRWRPWERDDAGENQKSVAAWIRDTFGASSTNITAASRANQEMAELLKALAADDAHPKAAEEAADVVICLVRLFDNLGVDMWAEVTKKMAKNRARQWQLDGTGCGYHVKDGEA